MKRILFILAVLIICVTNIIAQVWVEGKCYLEDSMDNSGTVVIFTAASPTAVTDSTYTNIQGSYQINLLQGIYDISYSHKGYFLIEVEDVSCFSPSELEERTLIKKVGISISGSLNGTLIDTSYLVEGDIFVDDGNSLVIEPGATFYFDGGYAFVINGCLEAVGTEFDSIKFIPSPRVTYWHGIRFNRYSDASDNSKFEYCHVEGVDGNQRYTDAGALMLDAKLMIKNCTIINNNVNGIMVCGANPEVQIFTQIINCKIGNNSSNGINIQEFCVIIENCYVHNNLGEGVYIRGGREGFTSQVNGCIIIKNASIGISAYTNTNITNCTITRNHTGIEPHDNSNISLLNSVLNSSVKCNN